MGLQRNSVDPLAQEKRAYQYYLTNRRSVDFNKKRNSVDKSMK